MNALFFLFLTYLVAPKVDIITGVRPEDIIFAVALGIFLLNRKSPTIRIPMSAKYYLIFVAFNFISAFINYKSNGFTGLLFSARLLQYFLWYPVLMEGCHSLTKTQIIRGFTVVSIVLIIWGVLEFFSVIPKVGNFGGAASRLSLNTGGPYEAAVMVAMLGYIVNNIVLTPILLIVVLLTQARITTAAVAAGYAIVRPGRSVLLAILLGVTALAVAPQIQSVLEGSRYQQQKSGYSMLELLKFEWAVVPVITDPAIFRDAFIDNLQDLRYMPDKNGDLSFKFRAVRWSIVYKSILSSASGLIFGFGPGAWGTALDGYHARLFGELGLIGVALFICWMVALLRESNRQSVVYYSLIVMSISAIFIDIFVSSKVMPLLWAFVAMQTARHPASLVGDWSGSRRRRINPANQTSNRL